MRRAHHHELIFVYEGNGEVEIEGQTYPAVKGTTVLFGRYARHIITNTGEVDMGLFWVFMPSGLEHWFRGIGRGRHPEEHMPDAFPRPDDLGDLIEQMRLVPNANHWTC